PNRGGAAQNHVDTETRTPGGRHGTRMATTVIEGARQKPNTKFYWTDSKTVLTWLRTALARATKPFVAHRIAAIEENSTLERMAMGTYKRTARGRRDPKHTSKFRSMVQWARIPSTNQTTGRQKNYHFKGNRRRKILHLTVKKPDSISWNAYRISTNFQNGANLQHSMRLTVIRLCRKKEKRSTIKGPRENLKRIPAGKI
ncbi:hypothetical protein EVAR_77909_1, partial [Eumeta japonica]